MVAGRVLVLTLSLAFLFVILAKADAAPERLRDKRAAISLFNVVRFKNQGCRSTSSITNSGTTATFRNGTCYTSGECEDKGGTKAGNCASGFGVCCVFFIGTSTSTTINENCTYLRNPSFPSAYPDNTALTYTVNKCSDDVCFLRLDMESFTTRGTESTTEATGGACIDTFDVTTNTGSGAQIPTICGQNTGQHMYIDIGNGATDSATLNFVFNGASTTRAWEIKVTQVECTNSARPPEGCLQYHTGVTGRFTTFNYLPTTGETHLANQQYSVCIRQEEGFCCVEYSVCADQLAMNGFSLASKANNLAVSKQDNTCTSDYIGIEASGSSCSSTPNPGAVHNKYCGPALSSTAGLTVSSPVCDCTAPFYVEVSTDGIGDENPVANSLPSRGACLEWRHVAC